MSDGVQRPGEKHLWLRLVIATLLVVFGLTLVFWAGITANLDLPFYVGMAMIAGGMIGIIYWGQLEPDLDDGILHLRKQFEAQFEIVGQDQYRYRCRQKGRPIPVTADERQRFINQYVWRTRVILRGAVAAFVVLSGSLFLPAIIGDSDSPPDFWFFALVVPLGLVVFALIYWAGGSPARQLVTRKPVGRKRSRVEVRAIKTKQTSYISLAAGGAAAILFVGQRALEGQGLSGWNRLWLVLGAVAFVAVVVQAFRKWRFEHRRADKIRGPQA